MSLTVTEQVNSVTVTETENTVLVQTGTIILENDISRLEWVDLLNTWTTQPVLNVSITGGDVYDYVYGGTTYYRFVPSPYDSTLDRFFSGFDGTNLTGLLATRGIPITPSEDPFDPEETLTLTNSFAPSGEIITSTEFNKDLSCVFAVDFTGLTTAEGYIFESGGSGVGAYVGFDSNGDLIVRCSDGGVRFQANTAYVLVTSGQPVGDGTLVFEFNATQPSSVRVWWKGVELGSPVPSDSADSWTGNNASAFLANRSGSNSAIVAGEPDFATTGYTTASNLRYYENQTVPSP